jgi:hypothetical protein
MIEFSQEIQTLKKEIMKKIAIALILLNIFSICSASSIAARQATHITKAAYNSSRRSITTGAMKPATRNKSVQAQEQAQEAAHAKDIAERETQINNMNKEFLASPSYSFGTGAEASKTIASKPSHTFSINKASFAGFLTGLATYFGYKTVENNENKPTDTFISIVDTNKAEKTASSIEANNAPTEDQQVSTFSDFAMKHTYENPKKAIFNIYNNPNGENALNALQDPIIGGTIATGALGGYAYYQYLQYLEKQAKAQKEKDDQLKKSVENENSKSIEAEASIT